MRNHFSARQVFSHGELTIEGTIIFILATCNENEKREGWMTTKYNAALEEAVAAARARVEARGTELTTPLVTAPRIRHDDKGMYRVVNVGDFQYDVVQASGGAIVASAARKDTADKAAASINACAIIPRMSRLAEDLYMALCELNRFTFLEGYTLTNPAVQYAQNTIDRYEFENPDKVIDHSKSIFA